MTLKTIIEDLKGVYDVRFVDRTGWPMGPWTNEPDRIEWKSAAGFQALMLRHETMGHWCGYVGLPPEHPWHGRGYDECNASAHGGLTYSNECAGRVCHRPAPGEPEHLFWIGFDCAHFQDVSPGTLAIYKKVGLPVERHGVYRDVAYVRGEVERLAEQAKEITRGPYR